MLIADKYVYIKIRAYKTPILDTQTFITLLWDSQRIHTRTKFIWAISNGCNISIDYRRIQRKCGGVATKFFDILLK